MLWATFVALFACVCYGESVVDDPNPWTVPASQGQHWEATVLYFGVESEVLYFESKPSSSVLAGLCGQAKVLARKHWPGIKDGSFTCPNGDVSVISDSQTSVSYQMGVVFDIGATVERLTYAYVNFTASLKSDGKYCADPNYLVALDLDDDGQVDQCARGYCSNRDPQSGALEIRIFDHDPGQPGDSMCVDYGGGSYCMAEWGQDYSGSWRWLTGNTEGNGVAGRVCGPLADGSDTGSGDDVPVRDCVSIGGGLYTCAYAADDVCPGGQCQSGCSSDGVTAWCVDSDTDGDGYPETRVDGDTVPDSGTNDGTGNGTGDGTGTGDGYCDPSTADCSNDGPPWGDSDPTKKGFDAGKAADALQAAQDEFDQVVADIRSEFHGVFGDLSIGGGSGALPCKTVSFMGASLSFCFSSYSWLFDMIRQILLWMAALFAIVIILRD
jgi:hypothetical protein